MSIDKGWHIYANPVGNPKLESAATRVSVKAAQPVQVLAMEYPPGKPVKEDGYEYNVYEDTVIIKVQVRPALSER